MPPVLIDGLTLSLYQSALTAELQIKVRGHSSMLIFYFIYLLFIIDFLFIIYYLLLQSYIYKREAIPACNRKRDEERSATSQKRLPVDRREKIF